MSYQILSKRYRPKTFGDIVGQEPIVTTLKNALRSGKTAYAYIFCGCRGTGKTTFARTFAKALNCAHLTEETEPCNACPSCQDVNGGRSLDVLEIDGASNRGIDDIRNLNETVSYAAALGKFKIYIIDEVHMLTKEAFNALLKTLEEPPPHVKFFFATTEPHKVPPTVLSRCQRFELHRIAPSAMIHKLRQITEELQIACEEKALHLISHLSEGSLRDAESLLDQLICSIESPLTEEKCRTVYGMPPRHYFFELDRAFEKETLSFAFELVEKVFTSGKDPAYFFDTLIDHYHTLVRIKLGEGLHLFSLEDKELYRAAASLYTEEQCLYILDYLIGWQQQWGKIPFKRVFLEMLLLHILRSKYRLPPATLVRRLIDLEKQLPKDTAPVPSTTVIISPPLQKESAPLSEEKEIPAQTPQPPVEELAAKHPSHYATLMHFAAVELEGTIQK